MDKPTELKPVDPKRKEELDSGDSGSMLDDLSSATKLKKKVPDAPAVSGHDAIVKLYNDYKSDVIRDADPTDEQLAILHGIAGKLLEK